MSETSVETTATESISLSAEAPQQPITSESSWRDTLSSEFKDHTSLKDYKSLDDMAKSHIHAQQRLGNSVQVPGDLSTADDWNKFYARVGRPDSADKYDFNAVKAPVGYEIPQEMLSGFREAAFNNGLNQKQASALMDWYARTSESQVAAAQEHNKTAKESTVNTLRNDWGNDYDRYANAVNVALNRFFPESIRNQVMEVALTNPDFAKAIADIGSRMGEDTTAGMRPVASGKDRLKEIEQELTKARHDFSGPYLNGRDPGHAEEVSRIAALIDEQNRLMEQ